MLKRAFIVGFFTLLLMVGAGPGAHSQQPASQGSAAAVTVTSIRVASSVSYRYLLFQQGGNSVVHRVSLGGPILMSNFSF